MIKRNMDGKEGIPVIRVRAVGDIHVVSFSVPLGAVLKVDGKEVV